MDGGGSVSAMVREWRARLAVRLGNGGARARGRGPVGVAIIAQLFWASPR
jgi:hypothetical protein